MINDALASEQLVLFLNKTRSALPLVDFFSKWQPNLKIINDGTVSSR